MIKNNVGCVSLLICVFVCIAELSAHFLPRDLDHQACPAGYEDPPLILVSMDGFRADYIERGLTPTIKALAERGVKAPFIKPSYPAITFPNHYTIVTGLLPPYHGIIANKFYDPVFNATFRVGTPEYFKKRYWGGEPIWKTVERQGKRAATYFWPGSEIIGLRPTYWLPYNESHPFNVRVDQVLQWIDLPKSSRPSFLTLYLHEPDRQGHMFGPNAPQVNDALRDVDRTVSYLLEGLKRRNLISCVNLLILADHGMAEAGPQRVIKAQRFVPRINNRTRYWNGVFPRFEPLIGSKVETQRMMEKLSCKDKTMRVYHKSQAPIRWHLNSRRIEDVVLDLDAGYQMDFDNTYKPDMGDHGYDYIFQAMNALFLAHGPSFKKNIEVESFQNIEIYNLMCNLLGVEPAPNNGTWGSLDHLLVDSHSRIRTNGYVHPQSHIIQGLPLTVPHLERRLANSKCDVEEAETSFQQWSNILWSAELNAKLLVPIHAPWGIPFLHNWHLDQKLLVHDDHITGYSEKLRIPLWTSFTLQGQNYGAEDDDATWIDDIRLEANSLPQACKDLKKHTWMPLFHPVFTRDEAMEQIPYLSSNAVPLTEFLTSRWNNLIRMIYFWSKSYGEINVVVGTVFDEDGDTIVDDFSYSSRRSRRRPAVPTHMFAVVTRCFGGHGLSCREQDLDSIAFVFPQNLAVSNCMTFEEFSREFMAKVDDVEKITGLKFYPNMNYEDRIKLRIRIHSNIWGRESWRNRIKTDRFGMK